MRHLRRFIGAVIVTIAFLAASSVAEAHGGHDHAPSPESRITRDAPVAFADANDTASAESVSVRMDIPSGSGGGERCLGGCCSSAHLCCIFNLPADINAILPIDFGTSRMFVEPVFRDGLDPEALCKPPRSFA